ncbi:MAG: thermonuclease family protein [Salinarimonas sp.]|nr:thermonuclease family protein [Salinarimonas sp.]
MRLTDRQYPNRRGSWLAAALAIWFALSIGSPAHARECAFEPADPAAHLTGLDAYGNPLDGEGVATNLVDLQIADIDAADALTARKRPAYRVLAEAQPDRWGRYPVHATLPDGRAFSHVLVDEGLARVDPGMRTHMCERKLLEREAVARAARRGIWADPANRPLSAHQPEALAARLGDAVIVKGRVVSVGERRRNTYLDFSRRWHGGFTVVVPRDLWQELVAHGIDADFLTGRRIRVRGVLKDLRGPAIELAIAAFIENLETGRVPP